MVTAMADLVDVPTGSTDTPLDLDEVRDMVVEHLRAQGFGFDGKVVTLDSDTDKTSIRRMHDLAVEEAVRKGSGALAAHEHRFITKLIAGDEITPASIRPKLVLVDKKGTLESNLWRWTSLHWSIPTSLGYGRRLRYLVVDEGHDDALIGLIGLQDPVFALKARDDLIGWDPDRRQERLTDMMDAFVLGAVPPYSHLLGGKLVALLATSSQVRDDFDRLYRHKLTVIGKRDPNARLLAITTASALGRSSMYNRLKFPDGTLAYEPYGYTAGTGDFHFSGDIYDTLHEVARAHFEPTARREDWGGVGFRNRREVIQRSMQALGFTSKVRMHGIERQLFIVRCADNTFNVLNGSAGRPSKWRTRPVSDLSEWWLDRWALPRADRILDYKEFDPQSWRLW